jgi:chromate transporter
LSSDADKLIQLALIFAMLSMLAVGGGTAVLPEMKHMTVYEQQWLTAREFNDYYGIGQFVPGPNMLMVSLIGLHAAGWAGAAVVVLAFFLPFSTVMFFASRAWDRYAESPWRIAIEKGLAPVTIGLMFSGVYAVGHAAIVGLGPALIAVAVALAILFTKIKAPWLMALGALCGYLFLT